MTQSMMVISVRSALTCITYNILFLLSAGGKLNYIGTKRWIEDQLDSSGTLAGDRPAFIVRVHLLVTDQHLLFRYTRWGQTSIYCSGTLAGDRLVFIVQVHSLGTD